MLDCNTWSGKIFNGSWVSAQGGTVEVIEPATGNVIATSGVANVADADVALAASAGAFGSFRHSGQICFTAGRHLVHERIAEEYPVVLAAKAEALPVGDPMRNDVALGPIINKEQLARVDQIVVDTIDQGAELLTGGSYEELFYRPTVLTNVSATRPAWTEEIFGPVAPITTFASIDEAVALANDSAYGLVAAVQTKNLATGLAVADRLRTGIVHISDQTVGHLANSPIGGVGMSGNGGRLGSPANLDEFTQWQWLTFRDDQKAYPF